MIITLRHKDKVRIQNNDKDAFCDIQASGDQQFLEIEIHKITSQKYIMREKNGVYKLFIIPSHIPLIDYDFGYWYDGDVVWSSIE